MHFSRWMENGKSITSLKYIYNIINILIQYKFVYQTGWRIFKIYTYNSHDQGTN